MLGVVETAFVATFEIAEFTFVTDELTACEPVRLFAAACTGAVCCVAAAIAGCATAAVDVAGCTEVTLAGGVMFDVFGETGVDCTGVTLAGAGAALDVFGETGVDCTGVTLAGGVAFDVFAETGVDCTGVTLAGAGVAFCFGAADTAGVDAAATEDAGDVETDGAGVDGVAAVTAVEIGVLAEEGTGTLAAPASVCTRATAAVKTSVRAATASR